MEAPRDRRSRTAAERALLDADFRVDRERVWRWHDENDPPAVVRVEFLADLDTVPANTTVTFDDCDRLGAANLRGTGSPPWTTPSGP